MSRSGASRSANGRSSIYKGADGQWHGYVTMGTKPDGKPDRRHRRGRTRTEVTDKVFALAAERAKSAGRASSAGTLKVGQ